MRSGSCDAVRSREGGSRKTEVCGVCLERRLGPASGSGESGDGCHHVTIVTDDDGSNTRSMRSRCWPGCIHQPGASQEDVNFGRAPSPPGPPRSCGVCFLPSYATESTVSYSTVHQGVSQDFCNHKVSNETSTLAKTQVLTEQTPACPKTKGILGDAPQSLYCPASHQNRLISKAESTVSYSMVHQGVSQDSCNNKASNGTSTLAKTQVLTEQTPACPKTKGILGIAPQLLHCPASHQNGLISKAESTLSYSMVHQGVSQDLCNHRESNTASTLAKTQVLTEQTLAWPKTKGILGDAPQSLHCPAFHLNGLISKAKSTVSYSMVHQGVSQDVCNHRASNRASTLAKTQIFTEQTLACPKTKGLLGDAPQSLYCPASRHNGFISKAESTVSYSTVPQGVSQDLCNHKASNRASTLAKTQVLTEQTPSLLPPINPTPKDVSTWQNPSDASEKYCYIL